MSWKPGCRLEAQPIKNPIYLVWHSAAVCEDRPIAADFPHFICSSVFRDLGVALDQELTFAPHIHRLCRDSYYQLRQLGTAIRSLTSESTATLIHAFVTARLDYCSSLYAGLLVGRLRCLDRVLGTATRLSGRVPKFGHVSRYMLAPPLTEDFVPYNFLSLAVPPGSYSRLSSRPLPHYHGNSGSSLSPLNRAGSSSRPICPHCNYAESRLLSWPSLWNGLSLVLRLFPRIVSNSFYAHLKLSFLAVLESGALLRSAIEICKMPQCWI